MKEQLNKQATHWVYLRGSVFVFPCYVLFQCKRVPVWYNDNVDISIGWQRKPEGKVREQKDAISAATFYMRYVKNNRPVVMRGALKGTDVLEKWEEDTYLKDM